MFAGAQQDATAKGFIDLWQRGVFHSFESMLVALSAQLVKEKSQLEAKAVARIDMSYPVHPEGTPDCGLITTPHRKTVARVAKNWCGSRGLERSPEFIVLALNELRLIDRRAVSKMIEHLGGLDGNAE